MRVRFLPAALALIAVLGGPPAVAQQQPDPDSPRYQGVVALQEFLASEGDEALDRFIDERIAAEFVESLGADELRTMLADLRGEFGGLEMRGARPSGPLAATLMYPDDRRMTFELSPDDPVRFISIAASEG